MNPAPVLWRHPKSRLCHTRAQNEAVECIMELEALNQAGFDQINDMRPKRHVAFYEQIGNEKRESR